MTHLGKMESKGCSACTGVLSLDNARSPTLGTRTVKECVSWTSQSALRCSCSGSVAKLCPTLGPRGLQHARLLCPSRSPGICSNSCPLSWWCHPTISSSVVPFFSRLQSFQASGSFQMSQLFASAAQSIGVSASASVLPMNIQDWFPLGLAGWISLQSKGLSRVFSNTTIPKHQFTKSVF